MTLAVGGALNAKHTVCMENYIGLKSVIGFIYIFAVVNYCMN